jgi:haloacetate dehalogenase
MSIELAHHRVVANGIKQHYVDVGSGPPVLLLHGFPETWYTWRKQIPALAQRYRLIIPDLRGYGATEKAVSGYDKRNMANDIKALIDILGFKRIALIGHDRGARVGTRFCKDHPGAVDRFVAVDNIPTRIIFERMNAELAQAGWFFLFNAVKDLPEALIQGREEVWLRFILTSWAYNLGAFTEDDIEVYVKAYRQPGALRGAFDDYRAWREDLRQDQADADQKIKCRTLALWGAEFEGAKFVDMAQIWQQMAETLITAPISGAGHFPHEESPNKVNDALISFLQDWRG